MTGWGVSEGLRRQRDGGSNDSAIERHGDKRKVRAWGNALVRISLGHWKGRDNVRKFLGTKRDNVIKFLGTRRGNKTAALGMRRGLIINGWLPVNGFGCLEMWEFSNACQVYHCMRRTASRTTAMCWKARRLFKITHPRVWILAFVPNASVQTRVSGFTRP